MKQFFLKLFKKKPQTNTVLVYPYAVQTKLMLDENTELTGVFVVTLMAKSKKDAKEQIKRRAFVKVGAVANKSTLDKIIKNKEQ